MNVEEAAADQVYGDTIEEIEKSLSEKGWLYLQGLLVIYQCSIKDLAHKIARAKGVKNVNQKSKGNDKRSIHQSDFAKRRFFKDE